MAFVYRGSISFQFVLVFEFDPPCRHNLRNIEKDVCEFD